MPRGAHLADSAFCGDLILENSKGGLFTDHLPATVEYPAEGTVFEIFVPIRFSIQTQLGTIWKTYKVYLNQHRVDLEIRFQWRDVIATIFRIGRMIVNPNAFEASTLSYATVNGGTDVEEFPLSGQYVRQGDPMSGGVTARGCLGATEGWVSIHDETKGLAFITRLASLYSVPMIHYEITDSHSKSFLAMINHSLAENDETSHTLWRGHSTWHLSVIGGKDNIIPETRRLAGIINGGLVHQTQINIS